MTGLFCANFAVSRPPWSACNAVWCGLCYTADPNDKFYQHTPTDEEGFDWRPPSDLQRHRRGRDGDNLICPFQCDLCWFRNLQKRDPMPANDRDTLLLCCIRRANLDALWGRESHTVDATLRAAKQLVRVWKQVGLEPDFPALGPYPVGDSVGFRVAVGMLLKSLEPGRHCRDHQQFETIRKLRAGFANMYMASVEGASSLRTVGGDRVKHFLTTSPTQSTWFERFSAGCLRRMGQEVHQDWAIPLPALHALMELLEQEWSVATGQRELSLCASIGAYSVIAFCGSFRGNEVFLTDLHGLRKYCVELQGQEYVIVPLLGRFKGEMHARYHLTPLAAQTNSGLQVRRWIERLVQVREQEGRWHGPAFCGPTGEIAEAYEYESALIARLLAVQEKSPEIIGPEVNITEDFGISRSFRRGSTSTARVRGIDDKQVELINRWRKFEQARGRQPALPMKEHYSDIKILIPELVKYSQGL
jgi:hypothetical protein